MPQVYVLDNVVMKLSEADASKYTSSSTKRLVIIDAKTKQVLEKKPLITLGRQLEFLLVSNETDPRNVAESNILGFSIGDFATSRRIGISVKYQVSCRAGYEERVALALFDDSTNTPGVVFEGKLINWLKDYTNREIKFSDFTTNYSQQLESLQVYAVVQAREIGLNLRLRLSLELDESNQLKPFSVNCNDFLVLLNDFEEEVNFRFRANLSISENGKVNAILSYDQLGNLKNTLQEAIQHYFRRNVSLYDFCYDFEGSVRKKLLDDLDKVLDPHGRKIEGFFPPPDFASNLLVPEPDPIQCDVQHEIQGYGTVVIKNVLEVEPKRQDGKNLREGILKYRKARIPDIREWFKDRLEKTIHRYLFDFSYVDILLKYAPQAIKAQLDEEAENVGYSVRLISTVPDLKPLKLRTEGFKFESSETFSTKQNSVKIKLGIDVRGKIENLESIKDILNDPQNDIDNLIAKEIIDSIKRVIHGVDPADFFAQEGLIAYVDDFSSKEAIKNKIITTVSDVLKKKFGASTQIAIQALNTELLDLINELICGAEHKFEVMLNRNGDFDKKVLFTGFFKINDVAKDRWNIFASRKPSLEDVRNTIQNWLENWLPTLSVNRLNDPTTKGARKLLEDANNLVVPQVMQSYGLLVSLGSLISPYVHQLKAAQLDLHQAVEIKILEEAKEQIQNDSELRRIEKDISLNDITYLNQKLESVRGLLRDISTQAGGEERKKKLIEQEDELKSQLSALVETIRKKSTDITSTQMKRSIASSTDESDFDALVQDSRALLPEESIKLDLKPPSKSLPNDDQVIDV